MYFQVYLPTRSYKFNGSDVGALRKRSEKKGSKVIQYTVLLILNAAFRKKNGNEVKNMGICVNSNEN